MKQMKKALKKLIALGIISAMTVSLCACGSESSDNSDDKTLNVIGWSSMFTDAQTQAIKEATGITINFTPFNSLEELYTKMSTGGVDYDMCVSGDYMVDTLVEEGMIKKLDQDRMKDVIDNIDDAFKGADYDPNLEYSIPEGGGTVGILVNRDKITNEITSWTDLFDESLEGQIVMLDDQRIILGIGNVINGNEFNDTNEEHIQAAKDTMEQVIPNVKQFTSFDQYDYMLNGEANIMVGWSYEAYMATQQMTGNWEYIYPEEGMHIYVDNYCLCAGTEKDELCYELIDYMMGDEFNDIVWSESPGTRLSETSMRDRLDLSAEEEVVIYPPEEQYDKGLYLTSLDNQSMALYDTAWTEFKQDASIQ